MVETVAAEIEGDGVTVQYGPAGVQWCTDAMLRLIGEASARTKRRVHMHLLETQVPAQLGRPHISARHRALSRRDRPVE